MTLAELKSLLETAFPGKVCYNAWPENTAPALPWVCFRQTGANTESADNKVYFSALQITIELYTEKKDVTTENTLENALIAADIFFDKSCDYLYDEKMYMTTYTLEV